jgi:hypothetical protein
MKVDEKYIVKAEDYDINHPEREKLIVIGNLELDITELDRPIARIITGYVSLNSLTTANSKLFDTADGYVNLKSLETAATKLFDTIGKSVYFIEYQIPKSK